MPISGSAAACSAISVLLTPLQDIHPNDPQIWDRVRPDLRICNNLLPHANQYLTPRLARELCPQFGVPSIKSRLYAFPGSAACLKRIVSNAQRPQDPDRGG